MRWLLVLPAAWAAWTATVLIGLGLYSLAESLCPPDQVVSGLCVAPWFRYADQAIFCTGAGLAAGLIIPSCTLMAPSHRRVVTLVTFSVGSMVALAMAIAVEAYRECVVAIVVGLLVTCWLRGRKWLEGSSNNELERTGP